MKKNLAIVSPNQNAVSETFIQAHRNLDAKVYFYFGGFFPSELENSNDLRFKKWKYLKYFIKSKTGIIRNIGFTEYQLAESFKQNKIQVVLAEYGPTGVKILSVCRRLGIPMIVHFHGFDATEKNILNKYSEQYRLLFDYAIKTIAVSNYMKNSLLQLGCSEEKILLNIYGPHHDFYKVQPLYNTQQLVSVGRFVEKKAPHLTILAFSKVVYEFPNAKMLMIGEGPLLGPCMDLVKYLKIENNVEFLGVQDRNIIIKHFSNSLAYVQHSKKDMNGDMEGTPVSILEASAAGLPVISTFHAGIPDVIKNEKTGLLVDEENVEGMSECMLQLLRNPQQAKKLGTDGKRYILENHTLEQHLNEINNLINQIKN
ncbi:glycosyltransferase family 4 protein [Cognataquiflexum rubidum]|uniref:glycosyltransferase family 4 protein n=1 Tax=Cognataquiflexum rubidum TaxID=2922273 RepID=UPI001F139FDE|nr:glycosyltransferase family 4 protein [Cognataquiflexum rubidum]MCH6236516.1 glycosyltransferase family 4 protein [Cognataquiflexum rubidum]